jgi:hypothetical protein
MFALRASSRCDADIKLDLTTSHPRMSIYLKLASFTLLAAVAIGGCGGSDDAASVLYKSAGSVQCSPSQTTQARLDLEVSAVRAAGASVVASGCANDGLAYPAACGIENGDLFSVTVSPASVAVTRQFGFTPASALSTAQPMACR